MVFPMKGTRQGHFLRFVNGEFIEMKETVASEGLLELWIEDMQIARFTCSPDMKPELALGFLITSGLLFPTEDCELDIVDERTMVLRTEAKTRLVQRFLQTQVEPILPVMKNDPYEIVIPVADVKSLAKDLVGSQNLYPATSGAHGALIHDTTSGEHIIAEDIGRLNAVDKVIGAGIRKGYDFSKALCIVTGKLTSELVSKVINARIPFLGSLTVATDLGIHLAMNSHQTLAGRLRDEQFWLYCKGHATLVPE